METSPESAVARRPADWSAITALATGHALIDLCQGLVPSLLPFLRAAYGLDYTRASSLVTASASLSSVAQPLFGYWADKTSIRWLLPVSIIAAGAGIVFAVLQPQYVAIFLLIALSGLGIAAFHPEAARRVSQASGDSRARSMSIFSVGGSVGFALAPFLVACVVPFLGLRGMLLFLIPTLAAAWMVLHSTRRTKTADGAQTALHFGEENWRAFALLSAIVICRSVIFYGLNTFLAFYWMSKWGQSATAGNQALSTFLWFGIPGLLLGGWMADRFGRLGTTRLGFALLPCLLLAFEGAPHWIGAALLLAPLAIAAFLSGTVLVVLGQEYLPNRVGTASGVTIGLAVSAGGLFAPVLGTAADLGGIEMIPHLLVRIAMIPALLSLLLPDPRVRIQLQVAK